MRHYEKVKVPEKTVEKHIKTTCDICNKEATNGGWETSSYEINETEVRVEVRQKDGNSYPGSGWGEQFCADICPECFKGKLIPWLKEQGCKAEVEEWDW
jgi:hypothetical protein